MSYAKLPMNPDTKLNCDESKYWINDVIGFFEIRN